MRRPYNHQGMPAPGEAGFYAGAHNRMAGQAVSNPSMSSASKKDKNNSKKPNRGNSGKDAPMMIGVDPNKRPNKGVDPGFGVTPGKRKGKGVDPSFGRDPNQRPGGTVDPGFGVDPDPAPTTNTTNETINNYSIEIPDAQRFDAMPQYQQRSFGQPAGNAGFNFRDTIDFGRGMGR